MEFLKNKKYLIQVAVLVILVITLPFALNLVKQITTLKSHASADTIVFKENDNVVVRNGQKVAINPTVTVDLTSPLGPGVSPAPSVTTSPSPSSSGTLSYNTQNKNQGAILGTYLAQAAPSPVCNPAVELLEGGNWFTYQSKTITLGNSIHVGGFYDQRNSAPSSNMSIYVQGVNGTPGQHFNSAEVDFTPPVAGAYNIYAESNDGTCSSRYYSTINLTVGTQSSPSPSPSVAPDCSNASIQFKDSSGNWRSDPPVNPVSGQQFTVEGFIDPGLSTSMPIKVSGIDVSTNFTNGPVTFTPHLQTGQSSGAIKISSQQCSSIQATITINAAPSPSPSAAPTLCTDFALDGLTSTDINGNAGHVYSAPAAGGNFIIKFNSPTGLPAAATISNSDFTISGASGFNPPPAVNHASGTNTWILQVPKNDSAYQARTFNLDGQYNLSGVQKCNTITINQPAQGTASCNYTATTIKFKNSINDTNWKQLSTIPLTSGNTLIFGVFHTLNGQEYQVGLSPTPTQPADAKLSYIGPDGTTADISLAGGYGYFPDQSSLSSPHPLAVGAYSILAKTIDSTDKNCGDSITVNVSTPQFITKYFKIAETENDLKTAPQQNYTGDPTEINYTFKDAKIGKKFIFVQFIAQGTDGSTKTDTENASIDYIGPDPILTTLSCDIDISGNGIIAKLTGQNLGDGTGSSVVTIGSSPGQIVGDWTNTGVTAKADNLVTGTDKNPKFSITLTRNDGQTVTQKCQVGVSLLSLGTNVFCQSQGINQLAQKAADITIVDENGNISRERVTVGADGYITGLTTKLQQGKRYKIGVKATGSLRQVTDFTAAPGTTVLPNFTLPLGDLNGDGKINVVDYQILKNSWRNQLVSSSSASLQQTNLGNTDLNGDGVINAFDLSCMLHDFNKTDEPEPDSAPQPAPAPSTSPLPSTSPSSSSSPSPSVSPSPSIQPSSSPNSSPSP